MTKWFIEYPTGIASKNLIEKWLDKLTAEQLKSVAKEIKMLEIAGNLLAAGNKQSQEKNIKTARERLAIL